MKRSIFNWITLVALRYGSNSNGVDTESCNHSLLLPLEMRAEAFVGGFQSDWHSRILG